MMVDTYSVVMMADSVVMVMAYAVVMVVYPVVMVTRAMVMVSPVVMVASAVSSPRHLQGVSCQAKGVAVRGNKGVSSF